MPPLNTAYIFWNCQFHDTDIRMYDRPCYWPSQGLGPESGARPTPNLFPMEYNSSPGELDTWCWCLNKVKVILKIVQFRSRIYILRLAGWDGWLAIKAWKSKNVDLFVGNSIVPTQECWTRSCQLTNPSKTHSGTQRVGNYRGWPRLLELWPGFVSKTFGIPWKQNKI